ncbi:hypothetical protein GCM10022393_37580 [Aquimarina addita]|uniref:Uncharacterized protein n=1 Tax=Aquimarina addita TaxID=870485 RepID=A0ABP6URS2_9FLAO
MKSKYISVFFFFSFVLVFAQKNKLVEEYLSVYYIKLPTNPILDENKRTYATNNESIKVNGFSKTTSNGSLTFDFIFNEPYTPESSEIYIQKDGKIEIIDAYGMVKLVDAYWYGVDYTSSASIVIQDTRIAETTKNNYTEESTYESPLFDNSNKALNHYISNRNSIQERYRTQHYQTITSTINKTISSTYGYAPYTTKFEIFLRPASKRNPEYKNFEVIMPKLKRTLAKMKYSMNRTKEDAQEIITYFDKTAASYPDDQMKPMRYACYFNNAKIYYFLDMPEKTQEYAKKLIDNGYNIEDGQKLDSISRVLLNDFEVNKTRSRHPKIPIESTHRVSNRRALYQPPIKTRKAYIISQEDDTIAVEINQKEIIRIGKTLKIVKYDENGKPFGSKVIEASECKKVIIENGAHFKNVKFKDLKNKYTSVDGSLDIGAIATTRSQPKLCKILFESNVIGLYLYENDQHIIIPAGKEKGKSTQSMDYILGFKAKLKTLAEAYPQVKENVKNDSYHNTEEGLLNFCKDLTTAYEAKNE